MNTLNVLKKLSLIFITIFTITSCSSDDDNNNNSPTELLTITDLATASESLSSLEAALIRADLATILDGDDQFTVFAPTNQAFTDFLSDNGFATLNDVPVPALRQVLLNHVIPGALASSDLSTGYINSSAAFGTTNSNLSMYVDISNGVTLNGVSNVTAADIVASNGIIHVVDAVIGLPTLATFATTNPALSTLVDALVYADTGMSTIPFIQTVSDANAGPFTVFAPTNAAFTSLLTELGIMELTDLDTATVNDVLLLHIVNANVQSSQLATGTVTTLGGDITADASAFTLTDSNGRLSNIVTSLVDIQAVNGVAHVIDKVILTQQP